MIMYKLVILLIFLQLISCAPNTATHNRISDLQLKSLDLATIRPSIVSLLGTDSAGLDGLSMITTYEDFLETQYPIDTTRETILDEEKHDPSLMYIMGRDSRLPKSNIPKLGPPKIFFQILLQHKLFWLEQLNEYNNQYMQTNDRGYAKRGIAAGYNALISGPTVPDITNIIKKIRPLLDSLQKDIKIGKQ